MKNARKLTRRCASKYCRDCRDCGYRRDSGDHRDLETVETVETVETGQDKFSGHCNYMRLPWSDF